MQTPSGSCTGRGTGESSGPLAEFRLKLLLKPGGRWRPIAVQETLLVAFHRLLLRQTPALRRLPPWQLAFERMAQVKAIRRAEELKRTHHLHTIDIRNAFNTIPHPAILFALHRAGTPRPTVDYIASFLLARHATDLPSVPAGVPQGDPLSMALFCQAIVWPIELSLQRYRILAYADDMILASEPSVPADTVRQDATRALAAIGLTVEPAKCTSTQAGAITFMGTKILKDAPFTLAQTAARRLHEHIAVLRGAGLSRVDRLRLLSACVVPAVNYGPMVDEYPGPSAYRDVDAQVMAELAALLEIPEALALTPRAGYGLGLVLPNQYYAEMQEQRRQLKAGVFREMRKRRIRDAAPLRSFLPLALLQGPPLDDAQALYVGDCLAGRYRRVPPMGICCHCRQPLLPRHHLVCKAINGIHVARHEKLLEALLAAARGRPGHIARNPAIPTDHLQPDLIVGSGFGDLVVTVPWRMERSYALKAAKYRPLVLQGRASHILPIVVGTDGTLHPLSAAGLAYAGVDLHRFAQAAAQIILWHFSQSARLFLELRVGGGRPAGAPPPGPVTAQEAAPAGHRAPSACPAAPQSLALGRDRRRGGGRRPGDACQVLPPPRLACPCTCRAGGALRVLEGPVAPAPRGRGVRHAAAGHAGGRAAAEGTAPHLQAHRCWAEAPCRRPLLPLQEDPHEGIVAGTPGTARTHAGALAPRAPAAACATRTAERAAARHPPAPTQEHHIRMHAAQAAVGRLFPARPARTPGLQCILPPTERARGCTHTRPARPVHVLRLGAGQGGACHVDACPRATAPPPAQGRRAPPPWRATSEAGITYLPARRDRNMARQRSRATEAASAMPPYTPGSAVQPDRPLRCSPWCARDLPEGTGARERRARTRHPPPEGGGSDGRVGRPLPLRAPQRLPAPPARGDCSPSTGTLQRSPAPPTDKRRGQCPPSPTPRLSAPKTHPRVPPRYRRGPHARAQQRPLPEEDHRPPPALQASQRPEEHPPRLRSPHTSPAGASAPRLHPAVQRARSPARGGTGGSRPHPAGPASTPSPGPERQAAAGTACSACAPDCHPPPPAPRLAPLSPPRGAARARPRHPPPERPGHAGPRPGPRWAVCIVCPPGRPFPSS
ncbi:Reverse transcriptase [Giardia duodenalis]|uniref:Reverse transcriptase n=1 Tax=Giardia intestinalis TaxID=5741 RepID=V6U3N9_GIAIN|nr:Reverse transcriptase [Giardia intestinalis]